MKNTSLIVDRIGIEKVYSEKTKFRLWLVGNPDDLGYGQTEEKTRGDWITAINLVWAMIRGSLPEGDILADASYEWISDTLYYAEAFPDFLPYTESYKAFKELIEEGNLQELQKKHEYGVDFAIPKDGPERAMFDRAVQAYKKLCDSQQQRSEDIETHLEAIKRILH